MRQRHVLLSLVLLSSGLVGAAQAAAPPPSTPDAPLTAATPLQVRARLGEPAVASQEGKGAMWTYRREGCALMVFFRDDGQGLRVSGLAASGRRRGAAPPTVEACMDAPPEV
jgi:hypothetical protein